MTLGKFQAAMKTITPYNGHAFGVEIGLSNRQILRGRIRYGEAQGLLCIDRDFVPTVFVSVEDIVTIEGPIT